MVQALATPRRFTVDEYYRMAEVGILDPRERVELIEGEIVRMAAVGSRHAGCVKRLNRLFSRGVGDQALVQIQDPVRLSDLSEPEPDVALLRPREDDYTASHPGPDDVLLLIEVADTTVAYDREVKGPLYAAAGIPEYWLFDLPGERVEVHREPGEDGYARLRVHGRGATLRPAALPELEVPLEEVLP